MILRREWFWRQPLHGPRRGRTQTQAPKTKGAEFAELGCVAWVKSFKSRRPVAFDGKTIFDNVKVVIECIWPETRAKSGASKHGGWQELQQRQCHD
jgi:hypothetical protein